MTDYYVKNAGNDGLDGQSDGNAWETIAKVNASSFSAGDNIYFNKGDEWREQLTIPSSGDSNNQITFGAYGSGDDPKITAASLITPGTSWTDDGSNVWYATFVGEPRIVFMDDN